MKRPEIEEQLRAIEAAIDLTQAHQLPVPIQSAKPATPVDPSAGQEAAKARELALALMKQFDERIAGIEEETTLQRQQQSYAHAVQQEQQEALEFVSEEVAALKRRTMQMEGWLRNMQIKPAVDLFHKEHSEMRQGYRFMWGIVMILVVIILLFVFAVFR